MPVLIGVGVSNAEQAAEVAEVADGVIVGSALVRRLLDGGGPEAAGRSSPSCGPASTHGEGAAAAGEHTATLRSHLT